MKHAFPSMSFLRSQAMPAVVWGVLCAGPLQGQCIGEADQVLRASDAHQNHGFGGAVARSGNAAIVGATADGALGFYAGSAYVYHFDGSQWWEAQKLLASDGMPLDFFGRSVSMEEDVAVVGASGHDTPAGAFAGTVYVYRFDGIQWVEEAKLTAGDAEAGDYFGKSVSLSGNKVLVSADLKQSQTGAAYVFRFDGAGWAEEQKLVAGDGQAGQYFGSSVSLSGDVAVVGATLGAAGGHAGAGAAYVYRFTGVAWTEVQKLVASDATAGARFGTEVRVNGDVLIAGAFSDDTAGGGIQAGSAYVFRFDGASWVEEQKLVASDGGPLEWFGSKVAIAGHTAVVGAHEDNRPAGADAGSAYVFRHDGRRWLEVQRLYPESPTKDDHFGFSVFVDDELAMVGGFTDFGAIPDAGSIHVFPLSDLFLQAQPDVVGAGDLLALATCGGLAGAPAVLFVMDVNGAPATIHVATGVFATDGTWTLEAIVPPGLSGLSVTLQSFGFPIAGVVGASNVEDLSFR